MKFREKYRLPFTLLSDEGNIAKIMRRVKPAEHADDVLAVLEAR